MTTVVRDDNMIRLLKEEAEMEEDIRLYDEAKKNDDGYRISLDDLKKEYGIYIINWTER